MPFLHQENTCIQVCPDYGKNLLFALVQKIAISVPCANNEVVHTPQTLDVANYFSIGRRRICRFTNWFVLQLAHMSQVLSLHQLDIWALVVRLIPTSCIFKYRTFTIGKQTQ